MRNGQALLMHHRLRVWSVNAVADTSIVSVEVITARIAMTMCTYVRRFVGEN